MTKQFLLRSALAAVCTFGGVFVYACSGDDNNVIVPQDAGTKDATGGGQDATPPQGHDAGIDASDAAGGGGCQPYDASALDDAQVAAGRALVMHYGCQQCHGGQLAGNPNGVPAPGGGFAYPPNLTPDPDTGLGCWTNDQIENAFLHGIDDQGRMLCPPMPHFADAGLDGGGAAQILAFLRSLPPMVSNIPDTDCTSRPDAGMDAGTDAQPDTGVDAQAPDAADDGAAAADATADTGDDGAAADAAGE